MRMSPCTTPSVCISEERVALPSPETSPSSSRLAYPTLLATYAPLVFGSDYEFFDLSLLDTSNVPFHLSVATHLIVLDCETFQRGKPSVVS